MRCAVTSSRLFRICRDWSRRLPRPLVPLFQNEFTWKPCHMIWIWFAWKWSWNTSLWMSAVSHSDPFWYRGKRQSKVAYCFGFCPDTDLEIVEQIFSCYVPFLFQGKENSGVKAVKDDKGASNSSADYENHSSPNSTEEQIDSFDELNLEEKQDHWT